MTAQDHPSFLRPRDPNAKIWRYMDRAKFEWMLQTKSLFFCRADKFKDSLEGHYTKANPAIEDRWVSHQIANYGFGAKPGSEDDLRAAYKKMLAVVHEDKRSTYVNCWHINERQSSIMWSEYAFQNDAVCVQSTFRLLHRLLPDECFLGGVHYIDYDTDFIDPINSLNFITHKDYPHHTDREIRAVIWGEKNASAFTQTGAFGLQVPVDLSALVEAIHVSPIAPTHYEDEVGSLVSSYGLHSLTHRSLN